MSSMEECSGSLKVIKVRFHNVLVAASLRSSVCSGSMTLWNDTWY